MRHGNANLQLRDAYCLLISLAKTLNTTLEADVDELRQIHNEATASKPPSGLPPAYSSLAEEDMPPYQLHSDSGALVIASLKRSARDRFMMRLQNCDPSDEKDLSLCIEPDASIGVRKFYSAVAGLYEASLGLDVAVRGRHAVYNIDVRSAGGGDAYRIGARSSFLACRVANLILELGWRVVSLNEIRPATRNFSARAIAVLKIMYSQIDDTLAEALRQWNGECSTIGDLLDPQNTHARVAEFQHYLTQLTSLQWRTTQLVCRSVPNRWHGEVFGKSMLLLQEAVENERMQQANRSSEDDQEQPPFEREGSVISSEAVRFESASESGHY